MADVTLYFESCGYSSAELTAQSGFDCVVTPHTQVLISVVVEEAGVDSVTYMMDKRGYVYVSQQPAAQGESYVVDTVDNAGHVTQTEEYGTDNGDGTYADLRQRITYIYAGSKVVTKVTEWFESDGVTVRRTQTQNYVSNPSNKTRIKKKQVT
jgi:hypothetical protein